MPRSRRATPRETEETHCALLVSRSEGTLKSLSSYLEHAGVVTRVVRRIERTVEAARGSSAIVLFPDDFERDAVLSALKECRHQLPSALQILVTSSPEGFRSLEGPIAGPMPMLVARPAWGWAILDAILAQSSPPSLKHR